MSFWPKKTNCSAANRKNLSKELRNFKGQLKSKWLKHGRHHERLISNENSWLDENCEFTIYPVKKGGRPSSSFNDSSENSKRRKTADIRSELSADVLAYAAQMNLRAEGKTAAANVVKKSHECSNIC